MRFKAFALAIAVVSAAAPVFADSIPTGLMSGLSIMGNIIVEGVVTPLSSLGIGIVLGGILSLASRLAHAASPIRLHGAT
jgi:hypothetical protein